MQSSQTRLFRIVLSLPVVLLGTALGASASDAHFEGLPDGVIGQTFTDGGITFSNLDAALGGGPYEFTIRHAAGLLGGMPGFTSPMTLGGFAPGAGAAFTRIRAFDMTTSQLATEARLEVFELGSYAGNTISLQALRNGVVVASHTVPIQTVGGIQHYALMVGGVVFDALRLEGGGPNDSGAFFALIDTVHIGLPPPAVTCAGDGSGTPCPCGNNSTAGAGEGCFSSLGFGATLVGTGDSSLSADTLILHGGQMPDAAALYLQGNIALGGGAGIVFGDGLRCVGGGIVRLGTKINQGGASHYPVAGDVSISQRGQVLAPGLRIYQVWYRNPASFCTPSPFNLSNSVEALWVN